METRTLSPGAPETRRGFFLSASASAGALSIIRAMSLPCGGSALRGRRCGHGVRVLCPACRPIHNKCRGRLATITPMSPKGTVPRLRGVGFGRRSPFRSVVLSGLQGSFTLSCYSTVVRGGCSRKAVTTVTRTPGAPGGFPCPGLLFFEVLAKEKRRRRSFLFRRPSNCMQRSQVLNRQLDRPSSRERPPDVAR